MINISFNPDKAGYLHDHFIGLNYEVNLSKPAGERIENVTFQGEPLRIDVPEDLDAFTETLWQNLNEQNRISLYVRYTDPLTGRYESRLVNKFGKD